MIALFGLLAAAVGAYLINRSTVNEAQRRVSLDLRSAWSVVQSELDGLELFLGALSGDKRVQEAFHQPGDQAIRALLDLARQYDDLKRDLWTLYGLLSLGAVAIVLALGFLFSRRLTGSVSRLAQAAAEIAGGRLDMQVPEPATDDEVRDLTKAFNFMAGRLNEREARLKSTNAELDQTNRSFQVVNRNYLDMLGFVSHELKNTLGVIYASAKALGLAAIGPLPAAQANLVANIAQSIEKAVGMTRKYLDLPRIEKGELTPNPRPMDMIKDVVAPLAGGIRRSHDRQADSAAQRAATIGDAHRRPRLAANRL